MEKNLIDVRQDVEVIQWSRCPNHMIYLYAPDRVKAILAEYDSVYENFLRAYNLNS